MSLASALRNSVVAGGLISPFVTHAVLTSSTPAGGSWAVIFLQLALASWFVVAKIKAPYQIPTLGALAVIGVAICFMHLRGGLAVSSGLLHMLAYLCLLVMFGSSLLRGREPIVMFFARTIHGPLSEELLKYTRGVTNAWCVFFALQLLGSGLLLIFAPVGWWSLFVNVLNAPLVCIMFLAERLSRPLWVANAPREEFAQVMALIELIKSRMTSRDHGIR